MEIEREKDFHDSQGHAQDSSSDHAANVMVIDAETTNIYEKHYEPHTLVSQIFTEAFNYFERNRSDELLEVDGIEITDVLLAMDLQSLRHELKITGHITTFTVAKGTSGAHHGLS